jgi:hypothetical protein
MIRVNILKILLEIWAKEGNILGPDPAPLSRKYYDKKVIHVAQCHEHPENLIYGN